MKLLDKLNYLYKMILEKLLSKKDSFNFSFKNQSTSNEQNDEEAVKEAESTSKEEGSKVDFPFVASNTLIDDINSLRTKLSRIEIVSPNEFVEFNLKLDKLEKECKQEYEAYVKAMTSNELVFTCNPLYNKELLDKIRKVQAEIDDFITFEALSKILLDRFTKLYTEISKYYNQYIRGKYKGSFRECISQARSKISEILIRVFGEETLSKSSINDLINTNNLKDIYTTLFYILEKCTIRYSKVHNLSYNYQEDFKSEYLVPLMHDLNNLEEQIEGLKKSTYYDELREKFSKIKTMNISNLVAFLSNGDFFIVLFSIEDLIVEAEKSFDTLALKNKQEELLNFLNNDDE